MASCGASRERERVRPGDRTGKVEARMVNVLGAAALAVGGYLLMRAVRREMGRVERRVSEAARKTPDARTAKTLERDPETGRYRPKD